MFVGKGKRLFLRYWLARLKSKQIVHFLHVSKTGGTAIRAAIGPHLTTESSAIFLHDHSFRLQDAAPGEKIILFFRDPIDRFTSAFYSRRRCGRPRYDVPWTRGERSAFEHFETANQLGRALSADDPCERERGTMAMREIGLLRMSYYDWIGSDELLSQRKSDILFIGFQEELKAGFNRLQHLLLLPDHLQLPTDEILAHRNPLDIEKQIDDIARANLTAWYSRDTALYQRLRASHSLESPAAKPE
jgi:hypothetical protein